jgi:hypothetical protein
MSQCVNYNCYLAKQCDAGERARMTHDTIEERAAHKTMRMLNDAGGEQTCHGGGRQLALLEGLARRLIGAFEHRVEQMQRQLDIGRWQRCTTQTRRRFRCILLRCIYVCVIRYANNNRNASYCYGDV